MLNQIATDQAPAAIGPYSQAIKAGSFLFVSGVIPVDPAVGQITAKDIGGQARQIMKNVDAVLKAAGFGQENVVKTTCFLADIGDFSVFNEVYGAYFTSKPARSCVAVKDIPKEALCEVEVTAYRG